MNLDEIKKVLDESFSRAPSEGKKRNIIFWYDEEGEFVDDIDEVSLENAKILKLTDNNSFYIKYILEKEDTDSNYLIYSPNGKPMARDNWLLDTLKYSMEFSTDKAVLIMRDFGVKDNTLRNAFKKYLKFFANKERYKKFASYHVESFNEDKVDIAVMSALCKLSMADFEQVLKKVLIDETERENKSLEAIKTFGDIDAFWKLVEKKYGYTYEEKSLEKLMVMLMVTHLSYNLDEKLPNTWQQYISPKRADCVVFVSNFMNHGADSVYYDKLADRIEGIINIKDYIVRWDIGKFIDCDTFRAFDQKILSKLKDNLIEGIGEFAQYRKIINNRRTSHWFDNYKYHYEALYYSIELLEIEKRIGAEIKGHSAFEFIQLYIKEYYLFDQYYRKFYFNYDRIDNKEIYVRLKEKIENTYANWYLDQLSLKWSRAVNDELLDTYTIPGVPQQRDFYSEFISRFIKNDERVFVIISDGLRFETGVELTNLLNQEIRGAAETYFMQGVVPSTTKFGMATLLPRKDIKLTEKVELMVDGLSTQGTENRQKVLSSYTVESLAIQYQDMLDMKRADYKETFEGKKLIYIYHNVIDAIGDKSLTEREVFDGVEKALEDLVQLVKNLVNHVSATNIIITADHGFIYKRSPLTEIDKISKHKIETLEEGRRYLLSNNEEHLDDSLPISMKYLLGKETDLKAVVPKGVIRYKIQGAGANYVHGGVSLQEITIPVIKFKNIRKSEYKATKVEVKLTNISRKITNRITYLEFFQTELVEEKKVPLKLRLYFIDEAGSRISNENIIIADSKSKKPEDRTHREKFTLKDMAYDKTKKYYLILEDEEEMVEKIYEKIPFTIDLLISDDFGI